MFSKFYKFYNRYVTSGRDASKLLPYRRGPKPKYVTMPQLEMSDIESKVLEYRQEGHNRYIIAEALKGDSTLEGPCSASTVYRIMLKHGISRLKTQQRKTRRMIARDKAGSLLHVDCHSLLKA